ncbi:MAG: sigma-70 family RNA polymerase sigma factor [Planctomycetes bacterium]|nr:sigma-70 family RNA polymerase sigma factor [Planctomycetota bacterium]
MNAEDARNLFESNIDLTQKIVRKYCYKHNLTDDAADEYCSHVYEKLIENDFKKIREFKGKSSYKTYLTVVISRILIDKIRSGGRWTSSQKALKLGKNAIMLEELIFRNNYSFDQAYNTLTTIHNASISREKAYEIVTELQRKRVLGVRPKETELAENISDEKVSSPDSAAENEEILNKKNLLNNLLKEINMSLSNEERLLLKMSFEDGIKVSAIARALKKERSYIDSKIGSILQKFKKEIVSKGMDTNDIKDIIRGGFF